MAKNRIATLKRITKETQIEASLNVDGVGDGKIDTGVPFFDHMLTLFSAHGLFDIDVSAKGDVDVDYHHTVRMWESYWASCLKMLWATKKAFDDMVFSFFQWMNV